MRIHKNEYQNIKIKNSITKLHKGRTPENHNNWDIIETFIITNRKSGIPVSIHLIHLEILKQIYNSEIKIYSINERIYRFLERANYSIRVGTHIDQILPDDSLNLINLFHKILKELCIYGINKIIENEFIVNIDETGLFFNLVYNNTINKVGEKNILIKTNRREKEPITVKY